jgi:hypothetical protein
LRDKLVKALGDYCIPADEQTCTDQYAMAAYDSAKASGNKCRCPCDDMYYDEAQRKCVVCDDGSPDKYAKACNVLSCPRGHKAVKVALSVDKIWRCDGGIGPVSCPVGQKLVKIGGVI